MFYTSATLLWRRLQSRLRLCPMSTGCSPSLMNFHSQRESVGLWELSKNGVRQSLAAKSRFFVVIKSATHFETPYPFPFACRGRSRVGGTLPRTKVLHDKDLANSYASFLIQFNSPMSHVVNARQRLYIRVLNLMYETLQRDVHCPQSSVTSRTGEAKGIAAILHNVARRIAHVTAALDSHRFH